jgi:hypothetical protein
VTRAFEKKSTQLEDNEEFVYNAKYEAWMPKSADPEKWAAENLAAPPPPPKKLGGESAPSSCSATPQTPGLGGSEAGSASSAPQTPQASGPSPFASAGGARFSARAGGSARRTARSRYVDTFNPQESPACDDGGAAPPTRPKAPAYKVFTPQRDPAATGGDTPAGTATPMAD